MFLPIRGNKYKFKQKYSPTFKFIKERKGEYILQSIDKIHILIINKERMMSMEKVGE